jgi:phytoene synthase
MNEALESGSTVPASAANAASADSVLASKGRSFHWARHFLGAAHAARATRLYRLCRHIDDLADEANSAVRAREALAGVAASVSLGHSNDPVIRDGLDLIHECGIDADILIDLIDGVRSDLEPVRMQDFNALLRYCYQVAGTVGLMMCKVLDTNARNAFPHAVDLGIAMQLTNICRDVVADAEMGRRYLPACMVGDVAPERLRQPDDELHKSLQACVVTLLDHADRYYESGERGLSYLPFRARSAMLVAARVYRGIGIQLRQGQQADWAVRAVVPPWQKFRITSQVLLTQPLTRSFWQPTARHDPALHLALMDFPACRSADHFRHVA